MTQLRNPGTSATASARPSKRPQSGAWIVTYADLMTILVCFFVLIISYSIQDKVKMEVVAGSMRDAFGVAEQRRFAGDFRLEGTPEKRQPGNIVASETPTANGIESIPGAAPASGGEGLRNGAADAENLAARQRAMQEYLEKAILTHPLLKDQADAIRVTMEKDGLQIIVIDKDDAPMFDVGAARLTPDAQARLAALSGLIAPLPNRIFIDGHADAGGPPGAWSPFDLTADRANAARAAMVAAGLPDERIAGITGRGFADPLLPQDPFAPQNRRVAIRLEPAAPLLPPGGALR